MIPRVMERKTVCDLHIVQNNYSHFLQEPFYKDFFAPPSRAVVQATQKKPQHTTSPKKTKGSVRFHEEVRVKNIKAKGKNLPVATMYQLGNMDDDDDDEEGGFGEKLSLSDDDDDEEGAGSSEEDEQDEEEEEGSDSDAMDEESDSESGNFDQREAIERLKDDLFADDEDEDASGQPFFSTNLTTYLILLMIKVSLRTRSVRLLSKRRSLL